MQGVLQMLSHGFPFGAQPGRHARHLFELSQDFGVVFQHFEGDPTSGIPVREQRVLGKDAFHAGEHGIKILPVGNVQRRAAPAPEGDGLPESLLEPFAGAGHGADHRNAELLAEQFRIHMDAGLAGFVHHVAGEHHRKPHFHDLHGQEQVALKGGGVHKVDDRKRLFLDLFRREHGAGDDFLLRVGRQRVRAGEVHHEDFRAVKGDEAFLLVHGHAGIVPHVLMRARIFVERGGFPAVRVARQRDADLFQGDMSGLAAFPAVRALNLSLTHATSTVI